MRGFVTALLCSLVVVAGCSSDGESGEPAAVAGPAFVGDVRPAIAAVEAELGAPQRFFEVTANDGFVNVFVATDDATTAVAYVWIDGELQPPAPPREGASGNTFEADDVAFDEATVAARLAEELPSTQIVALSVYGDGVGATYVFAGRSEAGGQLDIVVTADGRIVSVDPV